MRTQIVPAFPKKSSRGQGCEQNSPKNTVHVEGTTFKNVDESSYMLNLSEKHFVELTNMRVLLFVTTHMPDLHAKALKWVWPNTVIASSLLTHADVLFYTAKDINKTLLERIWPQKNITVAKYVNEGYQEGAISALMTAVEKRWFSNYDWVIRVNPDVIIRNETWIVSQMLNKKKIRGILVDCRDQNLTEPIPKIHTDFFAIRPEHLPMPERLRAYKSMKNAEYHATFLFENIWANGHAVVLPDNDPSWSFCRVRGNRSSVVHDHEWLEQQIIKEQIRTLIPERCETD